MKHYLWGLFLSNIGFFIFLKKIRSLVADKRQTFCESWTFSTVQNKSGNQNWHDDFVTMAVLSNDKENSLVELTILF